MDNQKEIIKMINDISGRYSPYEVFSDWVKCCAIAVSNASTIIHDKVWESRENEYVTTMKKYELEDRRKFTEMFYLLTEELEKNMSDVLGNIYMQSGMGSKTTGQFFSPYHLSLLMARTATMQTYKEGEKFHVNEPTCGGGGSIIAAAQVLKENGINYQNSMEVVAQDLDWKCVYMCYLQLSLLGISAVVVQDDTLMKPYNPKTTQSSHILFTPKKKGALI